MQAIANTWWKLVRFGFRLLYNELAFTYDSVSRVVSFGAWRCWQRAALKHLEARPAEPILELAHGTGNLQLDLLDAGYDPIGYDLSPYMGRIAKAKLERRGAAVRLVQGKAQQLPFPAKTFQAVICTFPTNFIFAPATLSEVRRTLRDDGQLIIVPNGTLTGDGVMRAGTEWLYHITGQREQTDEPITRFFEPFGFDVALYEEPCPRSVAQVIVARKKA